MSKLVHHVYHMCWISELVEIRSFSYIIHHGLRSADVSRSIARLVGTAFYLILVWR